MNAIDALGAALGAVTANPSRPATATVHDAPAVRLVVFRIEPGQAVATHTNEGTVLLTVLAGQGTISGADGSSDVGPGTVACAFGWGGPDDGGTNIQHLIPDDERYDTTTGQALQSAVPIRLVRLGPPPG